LLGLSDVPNAGDPLHILKDAKKAQEIADSRKSKVKNLIPPSAKVSLEDLAKRMAEADQLELRLVIKADVQGSVEAVADALAKLTTDKVRVAIIHAGVGAITENDINLAVASKAIVIGFSVRPAGKASPLAESEGVEIRLYNIIYNAVDDVRKAMAGLLAPTLIEKALGKAEVREVFKISKVGLIAGCMVTEGSIKRTARARVVRDSVQVWDGKIGGLKRFKDDAGHVEHGMECGIMLDGFNDVKPADVIECYEVEEVAATL
jgi:translation initiation factor IF-2